MNTGGGLQYILALEIIIVHRVDSKTPPGTLGRQLQYGSAARVTGLHSHMDDLAVHSKAVLETRATPLAKAGQTAGLFVGHRRSQTKNEFQL